MIDLARKNQVMGIVNATPDSFSDGGKFFHTSQAMQHVKELIAQEVDIIDVGGQSTRPGYTEISPQEEIKRVVPLIEQIREITTLPISVDTYFPEVAEQAILAGADIINDIKGLTVSGMIEVIAKHPTIQVIIMHSEPRREMPLIEDILDFFHQQLSLCEKAGIARNRLCFDPGVGFNKTSDENLYIMQHPEQFRCEDLPLLMGVSRKRSIERLTNEPIASERDPGSITASLFSLEKGIEIVRVHDVKGMKQAIAVWQKLSAENF